MDGENRDSPAGTAGPEATDAPLDPGAPEAAAVQEGETRAAVEPAAGEVAELKERLLRQMAETENLRRRHERELADARRYAIGDFARALLDIYDNLQRAIAAVPADQRDGNPGLATLLDGVELTERELAKVLERNGVRPIEALGQKLDPNLHQAVLQVEHDEAEPGTVVQLLQPGFTIHDRLLRAAMVGVAKGRPSGGGEKPSEEQAGEDTRAAGGSRIDIQA